MELKYTAARAGRLSDFLKQEMAVSTGLMNRLKWQGKIYVNGKPVHTDYAVQPGDVICLPLDEPEPLYPAEEGALRILYEDAHILAVDKPAGMLIHPSRATMTGTLANRVMAYYKKTGQPSAFHPITRLDRDTFGVVLLAKNAYIHALLNREHAAGQIRKRYEALVFGGPAADSGVIDAPIARRPLPSLLRYVNQQGKASVTEFAVLERFAHGSKLLLKPITGRTHQLRVHCAYMGFPILGDPQYGSEQSRALSRALGLESQMLLAKGLEFIHPVTGDALCINSVLDLGRKDA